MATKPPAKQEKKTIVKIVREAPENIFQFVQDVTDKLTVTRLLLVLLASIIATFSMFFYDNRTILFEAAIKAISPSHEALNWDLSRESKIEVVKFIRDSALINFALVAQVDLQKNRRNVRFWELQSGMVNEIKNKAALMVPMPVFDEDGRNTSQILAVLNGDFICTPYEETIFHKLFPELTPEMPIICRVSIPPVYGHATGILTIGLTKKPTIEEMGAIKQAVVELSSKIYMRDIIKKFPTNA